MIETETTYLVRFSVGKQEFGLAIEQVVEVIRLGRMLKTSEAHGCMRGMVHLGDEVIPIIDLRERLGLPAVPRTPRSRVIVVRICDELVGMIPDATHQLTRLSGVIENPLSTERTTSRFAKGTADVDGRPVEVLDVDRVLSGEELTTLRTAVHDLGNPRHSGLPA